MAQPPPNTLGHSKNQHSITTVQPCRPVPTTPPGSPVEDGDAVTAENPQPTHPDGPRGRELARAATEAWPDLPTADVVAAVEAGQLAARTRDGERAGQQVAAETGRAAAAVQRQGLDPTTTAHADWAGFGTVIPVLSASAGAGASVVTTVLADALQLADLHTLMIDVADPARSGLASAARSDGPVAASPHNAVRIRMSWRASALVAWVETDLPLVTPGMVPPPRFFKPASRSVQATVVDLGHDPWRIAAAPLAGAGAWLRAGTPMPRPVLVCRASRPSLLHAEQVLARLEISAATTAPVQLVVVGATRWPAGIAGCAGPRVAPLIDEAVFLPHDPDIAVSGITPDVTPPRLRDALVPVLQRWDLQPSPTVPGLVDRLLGALKGDLS